jgi:hypothetical protein
MKRTILFAFLFCISAIQVFSQTNMKVRFDGLYQTELNINPNPSLEILFASRSLRVPSLNCCETKHLLVFWVLNRRTVKRNRGNYL